METSKIFLAQHFGNYFGPSSILWLIVLIISLINLWIYAREIIIQYMNDNSISVISYTDIDETNIPAIKITICNSYYLDPHKILNYNGSEIKFEAYQFLSEAASGNHGFDDSSSVYHNDAGYIFSISSRVFREFGIDIDEFMLICSRGGYRRKCSEIFTYFFDGHGPCFQAVHNQSVLGIYDSFNIFIYFNASKSLGKYTKSQGAYVTVADPSHYVSYAEGQFIQPGDYLTLAAELKHRLVYYNPG